MAKAHPDPTEEVIHKKTGKRYYEWRRILDIFNVRKNGHDAAAKYLEEKFKLTSRWAQALVTKYDHERGLES